MYASPSSPQQEHLTRPQSLLKTRKLTIQYIVYLQIYNSDLHYITSLDTNGFLIALIFFVWEHEILSYEQIILNHRSNWTIYPELAQFCKPHFYPLFMWTSCIFIDIFQSNFISENMPNNEESKK